MKPAVVKILEKAEKRLNIIKILKYKFNKSRTNHFFLIKIYKSLIRSLFEYNHISFYCLDKNLWSKIQIFQNKAIRICFNLPIYTKIDSLHFRSNLEYIKDRLNTLSINFMKKNLLGNKLIGKELEEYIKNRQRYDGAYLTTKKSIKTPLSIIDQL
jgi:hypothetical protein